MTKELSRFEMAAVKRTAQNVKSMRKKLVKLEEKQSLITAEINQLEDMINDWEQPIIKMTGGFTSDQVLNGEMEIMETPFENDEKDVDELPQTPDLRKMSTDEAEEFMSSRTINYPDCRIINN